MSSDFSDWYNSIPQITRYWFSGSIVVPLVARFGIINAHNLILLFEPFFNRFHIWRPITALLFYPISPQTGFSYLINLYFLYSYSSRLETSTFDGRPADYLFMLIFNWLLLTIVGFVASLYYIMDPMILSVMYVWCQLNRDVIVSFWFGTQFKAIYLPWVLVGFNMIIKGGGFIELLGIAIGHVYFFLMFKYPQDFGGAQLLQTPEILYKYFPNRNTGVHGFFGRAPTNRQTNNNNNNDAPRNLGGRGYRLGDN
jgi:derlin-1